MDNAMFWPLMAFLALSLVVGIYATRYVQNSGLRFLVCGKSMPFLVIGTTLVAQALDGNATLGNTGLTFSGGIWAGLALPLGLGFSLFVVGKYLAGPLNKMDLVTLPEFFERRYGRMPELAASLVTFVSFSVLLAGNLAATGWILSVVAGWDYATALFFGSAIVFVYTVAGGLYAAIWTDFVQIYIAVGGFLLLAGWLLATQDWQGALAALPPTHLDFSGLTTLAGGGLLNWSVIISLTFGNCMALDFMERVFAAKTPTVARRGCYYAGVLTIVVGMAASFAGLLAPHMLGEVADSRMVLPQLAATKLPYIIGLLVMIGVVGASMSTCCGVILATSAVVTRNIFRSGRLADMDDRALLKYTRIVALPMTAGGAWFAYVRPEPGLLLALAFDIVFAGCVVPLLAGVYWRKSNGAGALASIVIGTGARLVCYFVVPETLAGLDTLLPPVISVVVFTAICLVSASTQEDRHHVVGKPAAQLTVDAELA